MPNTLTEILIYKLNRTSYSKEERAQIKNHLRRKVGKLLERVGNDLVKEIDNINND